MARGCWHGRADGGKSSIDGRRSVSDTVGRSGNLWCVWNGADGTQRLGRLSVGLDLAGGVGVDTWEVLVVTLARLKRAVLGVVGSIVGASDTIEDMLAVVGSMCTCRVAGLETEGATTHEVVPFDYLLVIVVAVRPGGGVEKAAKGIATEVGTVRVKLSSIVIRGEVNEGLVDETDNLDVVGGLHELNTLKGASGDETTTVTGLGAPGDFLLFRLSNGRRAVGRCPEAEIVNRIDDGSLAERFLVLRRRIAPVVTELRAANTVVGVSLVWKVVVVEMLGSQGNERRGGRS